VVIGLDRWGLHMFLPTDKRNATAAELLRRGHAGSLVMSQDFCATIDWFPDEAEEMFYEQGLVDRNWSMTLVFDEVLPALRKEGSFTDEHFQTIFVDNPRRWLAG
jgi:phosphotriesterase-related protein